MTRENYPVCPDLVRTEMAVSPEWNIERLLRDYVQMRSDVISLLEHVDTGAASLLGDVADRGLADRLDVLRQSSTLEAPT